MVVRRQAVVGEVGGEVVVAKRVVGLVVDWEVVVRWAATRVAGVVGAVVGPSGCGRWWLALATSMTTVVVMSAAASVVGGDGHATSAVVRAARAGRS